MSDQRRADTLRSRPVHVGHREKDEHLENPNRTGLLQSRNGDEKLRLPRVALLSPRKSKGSNDNQQEKPEDGKRSSQGHGEMLLRASLRKRVAHAAEIYEEAEHKMRVGMSHDYGHIMLMLENLPSTNPFFFPTSMLFFSVWLEWCLLCY